MKLLRTALAYLCAVAFCLSLAAIAATVVITLWDEGPIGRVAVVALGLVDAMACGAIAFDDWVDRSPIREVQRQARRLMEQQARLPKAP